MQTYSARMLMDKIAEGTWLCGDPGLQYEDTIQRWHTCPNTAPINSSNPCSEYMFIDDSACNPVVDQPDEIPPRGREVSTARGFRAACRIFIPRRRRILVDHASYPTDRIAHNSHLFPPPGAGLCQPRQPDHGVGAAVRLERGAAPRWPGRSRRSCTARPT